jgi:diphosphoinositol-polyphosphate diphosphatase
MVMGIVNLSKLQSQAPAATETASAVSTPLGMPGRIKVAPVCLDESLKESAMPPAALSKMCFTFEVPLKREAASIAVSSSSSTCTRESTGTLSDAETQHHPPSAAPATTDSTKKVVTAMTPLPLDRVSSARLNAKVSLRKTSRQGRSSQRWVTEGDNHNAKTIRLTTGCVPILKGGKIMFVSASRKPEWILPKGGWELDEACEESAVREAYEEAGVLGMLGPKLKDVQYETRKAKKRRLEEEESDLKKKSCLDIAVAAEQLKEMIKAEKKIVIVPDEFTAPVALSDEAMARIRGQAQAIAPKPSDETASIASTMSTATNTHVRMTLFPLYVSEVLDTWPECGRFRKAVDIDQAIAMTETRPELKAALLEVKERGLHLVSVPPQASMVPPPTAPL